MPVPGGELEAEMLVRLESGPRWPGSRHTDQEDGADDDMGAVEAGGHEEGRAIDVAAEGEGGVRVLVGLAQQVNRMPRITVSHSACLRDRGGRPWISA